MNIITGTYKHFKGNEYKVYELCKNTKDNTTYVLYKPLYNDSGFWIRPFNMFFEQVERDGKTFDRFTLEEKTIEALDLQTLVAKHSETLDEIKVYKTLDNQYEFSY